MRPHVKLPLFSLVHEPNEPVAPPAHFPICSGTWGAAPSRVFHPGASARIGLSIFECTIVVGEENALVRKPISEFARRKVLATGVTDWRLFRLRVAPSY
jgi:hypothetical protein